MTKYSGYNAIHLANSIISYTKLQKNPYNYICLLKLMKLSYIAWGNYLAAEKDYGLFIEEVQAWKFGPVIPPIWHEYKKYYLYDGIILTDEILNKRFNTKNPKDSDLSLWGLVAGVCRRYKTFDANGMVEITHSKDTPWAEYKIDLLKGKRGVVIPKEKIKEYYQNNQDKLLTKKEKTL